MPSNALSRASPSSITHEGEFAPSPAGRAIPALNHRPPPNTFAEVNATDAKHVAVAQEIDRMKQHLKESGA